MIRWLEFENLVLFLFVLISEDLHIYTLNIYIYIVPEEDKK